MLNNLKTKLGLGSQQQDVASVGMDDNNALLWDEISDHAASQYAGSRGRTNVRYSARDPNLDLTARKRVRRKVVSRRDTSVLKRLRPGTYGVTYRKRIVSGRNINSNPRPNRNRPGSSRR